MNQQSNHEFSETCPFCGTHEVITLERYKLKNYRCGSAVNENGEYVQSFNCRSDVEAEIHRRVFEKMDKSFQSSFVGDSSDKPKNTVPYVIPYSMKNGVPLAAWPPVVVGDDDKKRLTRKLLLIGGMCGAVREPNDILRDIASASTTDGRTKRPFPRQGSSRHR